MRLPNVFTAAADVAMGFIVVLYTVQGFAWSTQTTLPPIVSLVLLLLASRSLSTAGMVLNDLVDRELDAQERPNRPIPAGQISPSAAARLGWGLLLTGIVMASLAGILGSMGTGLGRDADTAASGKQNRLPKRGAREPGILIVDSDPDENPPGAGNSDRANTDAAIAQQQAASSATASFSAWWLPGCVAILLAGCIVAYDAGMKRTPIGPLVMGSCRFFNVLLGMSIAGVSGARFSLGPDFSLFGLEAWNFWIAGSLGLFVAGITWFARTEASESNRGLLLFGLLVMCTGIAGLGAIPWLLPADRGIYMASGQAWILAVAALSVFILRTPIRAIFDPQPFRVQAAVKVCIFSLIVLNAAVCLLLADPAPALLIVGLLIPTLVLGQWAYST